MFFELSVADIKGQPSFSHFTLEDRNPLGGYTKIRTIWSPNHAMREVHRRIIQYVRKLSVDRTSSTGAIPGGSPLNNVLKHRHEKHGFPQYFFLTDLSDAYGSVQLQGLIEAFLRHDARLQGAEEAIRELLTRYCMAQQEGLFKGGLLVGAPASPDLFNLYCETFLDEELRILAKQYDLTYTRYLDDLTLSSEEHIGKKKRAAIRRIIVEAGLRCNDAKTQVLDLEQQPITVNGVGIRRDGTYFLPRHALRHLRGMLHLALENRPVDENRIHGYMGLFKSLTEGTRMNETERKVAGMYRQWRNMLTAAR